MCTIYYYLPLPPPQTAVTRVVRGDSPPSRKKAHRLLEKFKKKQTRKVAQVPMSRIAMGTASPPISGKKAYQNIFDFERKGSSSPVGQFDVTGKTPKKPMVSINMLPHTLHTRPLILVLI